MRRVLVQDRKSMLFFRDFGDWTQHSHEARDFKTSLNALAFCLQHELMQAQVVIRFEHGETEDVVVPVQTDAERQQRASGSTP